MVCGSKEEKAALMRLVCLPDGLVRADPQGVAQGRGAYVCRRAGCAEGLEEETALGRSFRAPARVENETLDFIREWQRSASTR